LLLGRTTLAIPIVTTAIITTTIIIGDLSVAVDGGVLILPLSGSFLNVGVPSPCRQNDITQPRLSRPKI
jgi:hypothetical protein